MSRFAATVVLGATALLLLVAPANAASGSQPCGRPAVVAGAPTAVVVVIDGVHSSEPESGSFHPIPVRNPAAGVPVVRSYCPARRGGRPRRFPAGLEIAMRRWALQPSVSNSLNTAACRPEGGLRTHTCLLARLADVGAVVLPYSYRGARVVATRRGAVFRFTGYVGRAGTDPTDDDTEQPAAELAEHLDELLGSILAAWRRTHVYVVAHSWGGVVAETWWEQEQAAGTRPRQVERVFTLDSPLNGVERCLPAAVLVGFAVSQEFCRRWNGRDALDRRIIELARDRSFVAVGTHNDPTYSGGLTTGGGGNLRPQLIYSCPDDGASPTSPCIASPPSFLAPLPRCDGAGPGVHGATGHFVVQACPAVIREIVAAASSRRPALRLRRRCARGRGLRVALHGDAWAVRRLTLKLGHRRVGSDRQVPFRLRVPPRALRRTAAKRLVARVAVKRGEARRISRRLDPACAPLS